MSSKSDVERNLAQEHLKRTWQPKIKGLVAAFFAQPDPVRRNNIYTHLYKEILQLLVNKIGAPAVIKLLLSTITELVFDKAPDQRLKRKGQEFTDKAARACSQLGEKIILVKMFLALLEIGRYALDIYRAYSSMGRKEFGQYIVTRTRTLLTDCAPMIGKVLLSAIVGHLIGGLALTWVGSQIYLVSYVIYKGIEWATSTPHNQIVRDMERDVENEQTRSTVIFGCIEDVEKLRKQQTANCTSPHSRAKL
jgi:hypothetical protein